MPTKRQINTLLKELLPFHARVCEYRSIGTSGQVVIGAEVGNNIHKFADQLKTQLKAESVWAYGLENYLTLNF